MVKEATSSAGMRRGGVDVGGAAAVYLAISMLQLGSGSSMSASGNVSDSLSPAVQLQPHAATITANRNRQPFIVMSRSASGMNEQQF